MPNRTCDSCGKSRDVSGSKVCVNSHFVCKSCIWAGTGGGLLGNELKNCPLCKKALR